MESTLIPPEKFEFPFIPYKIQHDFMTELYKALENKKMGIFESPTGTGKSLSIICGTVRWLKDHNQHERKLLENQILKLKKEKEELNDDSNDWLLSQAKEIEITRKLNELNISINKVSEYENKINKILSRKKQKANKSKFVKINEIKNGIMDSLNYLDDLNKKEVDENLNEDDFLLEESTNVKDDEETSDNEDEENNYHPVKIYICSRTHSQLSQFIGELLKSPFGNDTRVVSLASRQNYCINSSVTKLKNMSLINEKCLEMQKNKSTSKTDEDGKVTKRQKNSNCKCPFYKQSQIEELRDEILTKIQDIEELVTNGKELKACPYYACRKAAEDGQVILVPYNTILHKATREANGIKLKNNVVIIDEAHNLLEALAQMYSAEITFEQLSVAQQALKNYKTKYSTRFSAANLLSINQLIFIITKLKILLNKIDNNQDKSIKRLETTEKEYKQEKNDKEHNTEIFTLGNFVLTAEIDNYNMFKLVKFLKESKISHKLHSFINTFPMHQQPESKKVGLKNFLSTLSNKQTNKPQPKEEIIQEKRKLIANPIIPITSFLEALTYSYEDGRILVHFSSETNQRKYQFLLLNPSTQFKEIVHLARSVIVAGGTMKPVNEFRDRLFKAAGVSEDKIVEFSCDHIIPKENILPIILSKGFDKKSLIFNFESRFSMGEQVKRVILETCKNIIGGIVIFFPSYKYENWIWQQLKSVKFDRDVFREPQDSGSVDSVLGNFADAVKKSKRGALLLSVVGGKLSEGLNFSDDLGRCVIVVGMPYANVNSPELKEKMSFLDKIEFKGSGQKFYEGMCMKAVNQCIGRAVRHRNDYATVILLDERYKRPNIADSLPGWIKRSLKFCDYKEAFECISKFFEEKNKTRS